MSSNDISEAMEAGDWQKVNVLIATASLTREELEKEHGVLNSQLATIIYIISIFLLAYFAPYRI